MRNSLSGIFEVVWFVLGGLLIFIAVDLSLSGGFRESWFYFLLGLVAFVLYFIRRRMRISRR